MIVFHKYFDKKKVMWCLEFKIYSIILKFETELLIKYVLFSNAFYMSWDSYNFLVYCFKLDIDNIMYV